MQSTMSKVTAVEYLIDAIRNRIAEGTLNAITLSELKMKAKEMEKEQIIDAYIDVAYSDDSRRLLRMTAELYYNETYK
jgi:hypothetical protein